MKKFYFLAILFFTLAVSVSAQDMIVLINGNVIEAKVEEISPTEIKYRHFDNLNGPLIIINKSDVYSIKYENGVVDVINSPVNVEKIKGALPKSTTPLLDPKKLYFSLSFEPSGFLIGGPSVTGEFTKGTLISSFHLSFPTLTLGTIANGFGFGVGGSVNHIWNSKTGGLYLGGLFEWNMFPYLATISNPYGRYNPATDSYSSKDVIEETTAHNFIIALNGGYRFVTKSGIYFRTGITAGVALSNYVPTGFYFKPDISTGYIFGGSNVITSGNNKTEEDIVVSGSETAFNVNLSKLSTLKINSGSDVETVLKGNYSTIPSVKNEAPLTKIWSDVFILLPREALPPNLSLYKRVTITCKYYNAAGVEIPQEDSQVTVAMFYDFKGNIRGYPYGSGRNRNMLFKESNVGGPSGKINKDIGIVLTFEKAPQAILFQNANENVAFIELTNLVFHNGDFKSK